MQISFTSFSVFFNSLNSFSEVFNANEVREKYESPKEEEINIAETNTSSGG